MNMRDYRATFGKDKHEGSIYIYIAGPMRGYPSYNFPAFFEAEAALRDAGLIEGNFPVIFNPARNDVYTHGLFSMTPEAAGQWLLDNPQNFSLRDALGDDTAWISKYGDVVCVLPGWENSRGAQAEVALARALGLAIWVYGTGEFRLLEDPRPMADPNHVPADQGIDVGYEATILDLKNEVQALKTEVAHHRPDFTDFLTAVHPAPYDSYTVTHVETDDEQESKPVLNDVTAMAADANARQVEANSEVRTKSSTGGEKGVKLARFDLIPVGPLTALAEHYGRGALKYADNQWRQGYEWSKSYAALQRHLTAFWNGEDIDAETGSHHLAAVAWHAFCLLEFFDRYPQHDDRYKGDNR